MGAGELYASVGFVGDNAAPWVRVSRSSTSADVHIYLGLFGLLVSEATAHQIRDGLNGVLPAEQPVSRAVGETMAVPS